MWSTGTALITKEEPVWSTGEAKDCVWSTGAAITKKKTTKNEVQATWSTGALVNKRNKIKRKKEERLTTRQTKGLREGFEQVKDSINQKHNRENQQNGGNKRRP